MSVVPWFVIAGFELSMESKSPSPSAIQEGVQQACAAFEKSWKHGKNPPSIEKLLETCRPELKAALLPALVKLEWTLRVQADEQPSMQEYRRRFPDHAETIGKALAEAPPAAGFTSTTDRDATLTTDFASDAGVAKADEQLANLSNISRYVVQHKLGEGTYGSVYLARDSQLDRMVAIKVARNDHMVDPQDLVGSLYEARQAVAVESEGIVKVLDIDLEHAPPYIVMEFVDGGSLKEKLARGPLEIDDAVGTMVRLVSALGNAHQKRVFHLDLKPANILLDKQGCPQITDFGFAIHQSHRQRYVGMATGTPAYMAPEQVRREANKYDGSTDIWSLGVIFYEMLTGQRPFDATTRSELVDSILDGSPQPLRQLNPKIPPPLERICLKCLAAQQLDRYTSTADLAADLAWWQEERETGSETPAIPETPLSPAALPGVRPQGLRSFDQSHADFYLSLLPGPFSRDGKPASVSFWQQRIESTDPDAFSVGVIFGPSGCGKSSLVSAGIVPQLHPGVIVLEVLCTSDRTELDLGQGLDRQFASLANQPQLAAKIACLRDDRELAAKKVLIILNQFEQFLHTWDEGHSNSLLEALRHCDGQRVQCLVTVRADFFHSLSRFMRAVGVPLREGVNMAGIDLFDKKHAQVVLRLFGQALGKIDEPITPEQASFLEQVVNEIARDGKVICVRLAVISEMMKHRDWTAEEWANVGRASGVGETFLEETFMSATAPPTHRAHQQAARHVLNALLPAANVEIKGDGRPYTELLVASRYEDRQSFDELLHILDDEIRLITPVEQHDEKSSVGSDRRYQLAHDYLVPSLRRWLTKKQRETAQGRAELLLEQHTRWWSTHSQTRFLPSMLGWAKIRWRTKATLWSKAQRRMMRQADRHVLQKGLVFFVLVAFLLWGWGIWSAEQTKQLASIQNQSRSEVKQLLTAEAELVPQILASIRNADSSLRPWMLEALTVQENWRSNFAILCISPDEAIRSAAQDRVLAALQDGTLALQELLAIRAAIEVTGTPDWFLPGIWQATASHDADLTSLGILLAGLDPDHSGWTRIARPLADWLVARPCDALDSALEVVRPVADELVGPLTQIANLTADSTTDASVNAAAALAVFASGDDVRSVMSVALRASKPQLQKLMPWLEQHPKPVSQYCNVVLGRKPDESFISSALGSPELRELSKGFAGFLDVDQAWCPPMPNQEFAAAATRFAEHGYRPNRIRAIEKGGELFVAASWLRDDARFRFELALTADELEHRDAEYRKLGFTPVDLSAVRAAKASRFCCLWAGGSSHQPETKIDLELSESELMELVSTQNALRYQKWTISALDAVRTADGERFAVLWKMWTAESPEASLTEAVDTGFVTNGDWVIRDIAMRSDSFAKGRGIQRHYRGAAHNPPNAWRLMQWWGRRQERNPASYVTDPRRPPGTFALKLSASGASDTFLEQTVEVKPDTNYLVSGWVKTENVRMYEKKTLGAHLSIFNPNEFRPHSQSVSATTDDWTYLSLSFHSGDFTHVNVGPRLGNTLTTASGHAWFDDLCFVELTLEQAQSPDWAKPEFLTAAMKRRNLFANGDFEFAPAVLVLRSQPDRESAIIELTDIDDHRRQARRLILRGFQLVGLDTAFLDHEPHLASVWERGKTLELANAAVISSKCDAIEAVLDLLKFDTEPNTRAQFISRLPIASHPFTQMVRLVRKERDPAIRQGLLLSMGGVDQQLLRKAERGDLDRLLEMLLEEADPGVRAAAEWLADRLGQRRPDVRPVGRDRTGTRWRMTANDHRLIVLKTGTSKFGISDAEVSLKQYSGFAHDLQQRGIVVYADQPYRRDEHPQTHVSWYEAAMYCRWLGEIEGLPETQQYYPSIETITQFKLDEVPHLEFSSHVGDRTQCQGYRLPTEAEWNAAAGPTVDPKNYPSLMMEYGRFNQSRYEPEPTLIRRWKPNLFGLFDMWGNVMEWCDHTGDQNASPATTPWHSIKGGSFADPPSRMELRLTEHPLNNFYRYGFRIARTWHDD